MSAHGYDKKRFPLTAAQGRVLYHLERLFRSTGHGMREHARYIVAIRAAGLDPARVADWSQDDCVLALGLMEHCASTGKGFHFRACDTGRADFMPGGRFAREYVRPHDCAGVT